ncbi:MAG: MoxR family ATPase [Acidiferrobacterales bacterium]|jgi:MoxR-like ATPase|nr:MoxR family ATPase [Acidiferrobacterales bacterium]
MSTQAQNILPQTQALLDRTIHTVGEIVVGKERQVKLALSCLLAGGHLLIEDQPGVGKTTLAHVLARVLGLEFQRIQFTSDLMPADILGVSIYDAEQKKFHFHPGPIFTQLVLADEVNRATPKTQSALLEVMEEGQITADGETFKVPEPFFVVATQNPRQQIGTFSLPESQLDRFLMRIEMGYPDRESERKLLEGEDRRKMFESLKPVITPQQLAQMQEQARAVVASPALINYVQDLLDASRSNNQFGNGLSPRAGLALLSAARAWALISGRTMVLPEDVQAVAPGVMSHRLMGHGDLAGPSDAAVRTLIESVAIP